MKKLFFIYAILCLSLSICAQAYQYHPFDSTYVAQITYEHQSGPWNIYRGGDFHSLKRDTTINGKHYKLLESFSGWTFNCWYNTLIMQMSCNFENISGQYRNVLGAIREDSLHRVYFYNLGNPFSPNPAHYPLNEDVLIFDFGLSLGDTIFQRFDGSFMGIDTIPMVVDKVDSVLLLDGTYRKKIELVGVMYDSVNQLGGGFRLDWVEGVGAMRNPSQLGSFWTFSEGILGGTYDVNSVNVSYYTNLESIACFSEYGIKLLGDSLSDCDTIPLVYSSTNEVLEKLDVDVSISPNPFDQETTIWIKGIDCTILSLQLYDVNGRELEFYSGSSSTHLTIQRRNLENGIYFYQLWGDKKLVKTGKIVLY